MNSIRFGLVAITICGIAALGSRLQVAHWMDQAAALAGRQEAATDRIVELRNTMAALADLETGQRGYMLTGEEDYLQPYIEGGRRLDTSLTRVMALFPEPEMEPRIDEIARLARGKRQELGRTVALRRSGDVEGALAVVKSGEGERLMEDFRDKADALTAQLRRDRMALVAKEAHKFRQVSLLGSVVVVLMILLIVGAVGWLSLSIRRLDALQRAREREAMHDALTGLPNRRYLNESLRTALAAAERGSTRLALLYFDLDGFKAVNDNLGHDAGDRVLQVTADRLRRIVRGSDFVARLGGDEFVAMLPDAPEVPELSALVGRLSQTLAQAPIPGLTDGAVTASIGIACFPGDGADAEGLLRHADQAMYTVKEQRRGTRDGRADLTTRAVAS